MRFPHSFWGAIDSVLGIAFTCRVPNLWTTGMKSMSTQQLICRRWMRHVARAEIGGMKPRSSTYRKRFESVPKPETASPLYFQPKFNSPKSAFLKIFFLIGLPFQFSSA